MKRFILYLTWAWEILIGYILITPIGPICIACGPAFQPQGSLGRTAIVTLGAISIVMGILGFASAGRAQASGAAAGR